MSYKLLMSLAPLVLYKSFSLTFPKFRLPFWSHRRPVVLAWEVSVLVGGIFVWVPVSRVGGNQPGTPNVLGVYSVGQSVWLQGDPGGGCEPFCWWVTARPFALDRSPVRCFPGEVSLAIGVWRVCVRFLCWAVVRSCLCWGTCFW